MSDWLNPDALLFYSGEEPEALKARFIELCARYPHQSIFEIGQFIFKGLPEAFARGAQAAKVWSENLDVQERIRQARINGASDINLPSKEQTAKQLLEIAQNPHTPDKERISAYKLYSEIMGFVSKEKASNANNAELLSKLMEGLPS